MHTITIQNIFSKYLLYLCKLFTKPRLTSGFYLLHEVVHTSYYYPSDYIEIKQNRITKWISELFTKQILATSKPDDQVGETL